MDRNTPPSPAPAPTRAEPLPTGFNELLQHNTAATHARESTAAESIHAHSQPASRYGTPAPQQHHPQGFDSSTPYQQRGGGGNLVRKYCTFRVFGPLTCSSSQDIINMPRTRTRTAPTGPSRR